MASGLVANSRAAEAELCIERGDAASEEEGGEEAALKLYLQAARLAPDDFEAWTSAGRSLVDLGGRHTEAAACFEHAAKADPSDPDLRLYRANSLSLIGDYSAAAQCIDAAIELLRANGGGDDTEGAAEALADAYVMRGTAALHLGRTSESLEYYARALLVQPGRCVLQHATCAPRGSRALL